MFSGFNKQINKKIRIIKLMKAHKNNTYWIKKKIKSFLIFIIRRHIHLSIFLFFNTRLVFKNVLLCVVT